MNGRHPLAAVMAATPHRHPMLLIDRLEGVEPGRHGSALKAVSANEAPGRSAAAGMGMPPTLVVDALGQLAIVVLARPAGETGTQPPVYYLADIAEMEFGDAPVPGDLLHMEATVQRTWGRTSRVQVRGDVGGRAVAAGTLILSRGESRRDPARGEGEPSHV